MRAVGPGTCALYRDVDDRKLLVRGQQVSLVPGENYPHYILCESCRSVSSAAIGYERKCAKRPLRSLLWGNYDTHYMIV